jgi:hypothetical protein
MQNQSLLAALRGSFDVSDELRNGHAQDRADTKQDFHGGDCDRFLTAKHTSGLYVDRGSVGSACD